MNSAASGQIGPAGRRGAGSEARLARLLARRRVPLGFAAGAIVLWFADPTRQSLLVGAATACVGEALRMWAAGHLYKAREVTVSGPYRFVRHPLYVGSSLMGAGLALASASVGVAIIIALYLLSTISAAIRSEEAFLKQAFGAEYDLYRRGDLESGQARGFSIRRALANHEHRTVAGLAGAILLLILKATYNGSFWGAAGH